MLRRDDPRLGGLFRDNGAMLRFIAFSIAFMLDEGGKLNEALAALEDRGYDAGRLVGGKPLSHWVGHSPEAIRAAVGEEKAAEILALLAPPTVATVAPPPAPVAITESAAPAPPSIDDKPPAPPTRPETPPVAPGDLVIAGHPLADFEGLSDAQILALPGIGRAALKQIRAAQKS